jgi:hypothetical protein
MINPSNLKPHVQEQLLKDICGGMIRFCNNNPHAREPLLEDLVNMLDLLSEDDFFGTEGWEHCFGVEE